MTVIDVNVQVRLPMGGENQCVGCDLFFAGLEGFEYHVSHEHMAPGLDDVRYWATESPRGPVWHFSRTGKRFGGEPVAPQDRPPARTRRPRRAETVVRVRICREGPARGSWARYAGRVGTVTARNDPDGEVEVTFDEGSPRKGWFLASEFVVALEPG